jgi:hypothetical protein
MPHSATRHPGGDGPLAVIEYRDKPGLWLTEGSRSGRMSDDRSEVARSAHDLNLIRAAALPTHESIDFIRNIRETSYEYWRKSSYSGGMNSNCVEVRAWRKSTHSSTTGRQCVEVATANGVLMRDTTDRGGFTLSVPAAAWTTFLTTLR